MNALKAFDKNKSGYINVNDVKTIITKIGDILSLGEFETVISEVGIINGLVRIDDLVNLLIMQ